MKKIIENKQIIKACEVFVAEDGKRFDDENECIEYEAALTVKNERLSAMTIPQLKGLIPPMNDCGEENTYNWFKVQDANDMEFIDDEFGGQFSIGNYIDFEKWTYPTLVCIEENEYGDAWAYNIEGIKERIQYFCDRIKEARAEIEGVEDNDA